MPGEYVVQPEDTLRSIAERFGTTIERLIEANKIEDPDLIRTGSTLRIPAPTASVPSPPATPETTPTHTATPEPARPYTDRPIHRTVWKDDKCKFPLVLTDLVRSGITFSMNKLPTKKRSQILAAHTDLPIHRTSPGV